MKKFIISMILACFSTIVTAAPAKEKRIVFSNENFVVLRGEVNENSVTDLSEQILASKEKELYLYISSPGGSVLDGMHLINVMKNSGKKINCIASQAASMAFAILQACNKRYVMESSVLMQHVMSYGTRGREPNNWSLASFVRKLSEKMDKDQAKRMKMSYKEFKDKVRDDWWMFGEESIETNAADELASVSCTAELTAKRIKKVVKAMFWDIHVEWSACPLIEGPLKVDANGRFGHNTVEGKLEYESIMKSISPPHIMATKED